MQPLFVEPGTLNVFAGFRSPHRVTPISGPRMRLVANLPYASATPLLRRLLDLRGAILYETDLRGAILYEADLREAILSEADLREAILNEANLRGANLSEADLSKAKLRGLDLSGVDLSDSSA